ncbi:MAG: c-type cytochrome [Dyella sp.]
MRYRPTQPLTQARRRCLRFPWLGLAALLTCLVWVGPSAAQTVTPSGSAPLALCAACHGAQGQGSVAGFPRLAGQNAGYLAQALSKFRDKSRASVIMQPIAQGLSDDQIQQMAAYFSAQHPAPIVAASPPAAALVQAGDALAHSGASTVASCFSCHGSDGRGVGARFPAIVGQPDVFVVARLHEFQARAKAGGAKPGTMTAVSAQMTEAQIQEAAAFLSVSAP